MTVIVGGVRPSPTAAFLFAVIVLNWLTFGFASTYYAESKAYKQAFTRPLGRTSAFYFTVTTLTTTGYGDVAPSTDRTRLEVSVQQIFGVASVGLIISMIASSLVRREEERERKDVSTEEDMVLAWYPGRKPLWRASPFG